MAKKETIPDNYVFESRLKTDGERGWRIRKILEEKQKKEHRKTLTDTIEAIILEYGDNANNKGLHPQTGKSLEGYMNDMKNHKDG